mgnify:CR=1 FL=1
MGPKLVDHLLYEREDNGILWIKFNRPERMNAILGSAEENGTVAKVGEYMRAADDDPNVRVIVLTGVGRGFCAGADVKGGVPDDVKGQRFVGDRGIDEGPDASRQHFFYNGLDISGRIMAEFPRKSVRAKEGGAHRDGPFLCQS